MPQATPRERSHPAGVALARALAAVRTGTIAAALGACAGSPVAPTPITDGARTIAVSAGLLDAVGDAEQRVLPALDPAQRPAFEAAIAELRLALASGELVRSGQAMAGLRTLVARAMPTAEAVEAATMGDVAPEAAVAAAADLATLEMLVGAAEREIAAAADATGATP